MKNMPNPLLTPNQITIGRLILTFFMFGLWFFTENLNIKIAICIGFMAIFVADAWDGVVARKYGLSSLMGIYLDPVVDVISYSALCLLLIDAGLLPLWFFFLYLTVTSLAGFVKQYAAAQNRIVSASILAKVKADLVSVPLGGWFIINYVDASYQPMIILLIAAYLFGFKFIFDPHKTHTAAIRITLAFLTLVFLIKPESILLPTYYGNIYLVLASIMHLGSAIFYFWDNRTIMFSEETLQNLENPTLIVEPVINPETVSIEQNQA
jgi:phosphatidylglycerophosphate synthase